MTEAVSYILINKNYQKIKARKTIITINIQKQVYTNKITVNCQRYFN
jgi:hypothetical protein